MGRKYMAKAKKKRFRREMNAFWPQTYHKWIVQLCCGIIHISLAISFFYRSENESVRTNFILLQDVQLSLR